MDGLGLDSTLYS